MTDKPPTNSDNPSIGNAELKPSTRLVQAGRRKEWTGAVVNPPIWRGSTHLYPDTASLDATKGHNKDGVFFYGRRGAPTQWALADALTQLEPGADGTVLYPSGVAAITGALLAILKPGDKLLIQDNVYEPTRLNALDMFKGLGIHTEFFDPFDLDGFAKQFDPATKAVMLENPGSLTMELCDIPALAQIARDKGAISLIDNTWATSLGFPALAHGVDIAITSLTKHIGGHSDLMMGSASAKKPLYQRLRLTAQALGHIVSPDEAALALRGLRSMQLRLDHSSQSAVQIAQWLEERDEVAHVLCPMLPSDPGYALFQRDFTNGCGLFSFVLKGQDKAARARFLDALQCFGIGYSWGGFESLALPFDPASCRSATSWPPAGWNAEDCLGIRLAIGLEDAQDLIADLKLGFAAMERG